MRAWNAAKSLVTSNHIQHEYQHKKSLKLSNICWLVVRICVVTQTERRKSLICFIFTICYILWLDFDRILDGIVRSHSRPESTEHSFCCCWRFFFVNWIFSRAMTTLLTMSSSCCCGPFVVQTHHLLLSFSFHLWLVYLILFDLCEHHHFLLMDSNELFFLWLR